MEGANAPLPMQVDGERLDIATGDRIYVGLRSDEEGFTVIDKPRLDRPDSGDYLEVRVGRIASRQFFVDFPMDRFYLPEELAPLAEKAYRDHSRRGKRDAYILVRIRRGRAVVEDLYVGGRTIREFIEGGAE